MSAALTASMMVALMVVKKVELMVALMVEKMVEVKVLMMAGE